MKVVFINTVCGSGSTGRICADIARNLIVKNHEVRICYGRGSVPADLNKYAVNIESEMGVRLHAIETRLFDNSGFSSRRATKKFIKWLENYNPDIIHLHNLHGYYLNIEMFFDYLKKNNQKIIWTLHDCWPFTGHCAYFDFAGCDKWITQCEKCVQKKEYPKSIFVDNSYNNYTIKRKLFAGLEDMVIVTPSEWLKGLVKVSFLKEYPIKVINNGIDIKQFIYLKSDLRKRYHIGQKKVILGVASVWNQRKGLEFFLELAQKLNNNYQIVLIGLNDKQLSAMPSNIIGIKKTESIKNLAEWYSTADVFVNPTLEDNYPTTNLEAQACGTPAITFRTGGSIESVPSRNVVEVKDVEGLIKRIEEICEEKRNGTFELCKIKSIDEFTNEYIKLYEQIKEEDL